SPASPRWRRRPAGAGGRSRGPPLDAATPSAARARRARAPPPIARARARAAACRDRTPPSARRRPRRPCALRGRRACGSASRSAAARIAPRSASRRGGSWRNSPRPSLRRRFAATAPASLRSQPAVAERALRRRQRSALFGRHHFDVRILGQRHARAARGAGPISEHDRDAVAWFMARQYAEDVGVAGDALSIDLAQLVVLLDAGGVERPGRGHERRDADAAPRLEAQIAEPGAAGVALAHGEAGAAEQLRVIGHFVAADVAGEEIAGECPVAADLGERRLGIVDRVGTIDVAFARAAGLAVLPP